ESSPRWSSTIPRWPTSLVLRVPLPWTSGEGNIRFQTQRREHLRGVGRIPEVQGSGTVSTKDVGQRGMVLDHRGLDSIDVVERENRAGNQQCQADHACQKHEQLGADRNVEKG